MMTRLCQVHDLDLSMGKVESAPSQCGSCRHQFDIERAFHVSCNSRISDQLSIISVAQCITVLALRGQQKHLVIPASFDNPFELDFESVPLRHEPAAAFYQAPIRVRN